MNHEIKERYHDFLIQFWGKEAERAAMVAHAQSGWQRYSPTRLEVAREQLVYKLVGIDVGKIDGLVGPQTEYARDAYQEWLKTGKVPAWNVDTPVVSPPPPHLPFWPKQSEMGRFYGVPGDAIRGALVKVRCPWKLTIAWDTRQKTDFISIHKKCASSLEHVLHKIDTTYSDKERRDLGLHLYGGSYNHRKIRGGTGWSTHAYGAAIDWDPARNGLRTRSPNARLSHPDAVPFWEAWEAEDWLSLGRTKDYDWMHVQAAHFG